MSFPENLDKPSRTIMATKSGSTRESMILKGKGKGNGEYRLPTIREIASLMGFPFVFNFYGSESTKWRQVGNAVCPHMSFALAKEIKKKMILLILLNMIILILKNWLKITKKIKVLLI